MKFSPSQSEVFVACLLQKGNDDVISIVWMKMFAGITFMSLFNMRNQLV